jgi:bidirectional [NiFe] hydrogenase diaphorase subunit
VTVCAGTACYIKGADKLIAAAEKRLGIKQGQTTPDGKCQPDDGALRGRMQPRAGGLVRRRSGGRDDAEQMLEQLERWTWNDNRGARTDCKKRPQENESTTTK